MIRAACFAAFVAALSSSSPLHLRVSPILAFGPHDLAVSVIARPVDQDREEVLLLCDLTDDEPCTRTHHERLSQRSVNGSDDSALWTPPPWRSVPPGTWAVVASLGPVDQVRLAAVAKVTLLAPD